MSRQPAYTIGILGLGQMGGSLATALKSGRQYRTVLGYDIKTSLVTWAKKDRIIDRAAVSEADLIERSQIVILALPINTILDMLEYHKQALSAKKLVVDLGSVRGSIQRASSRLRMRNHVGIHPICGTELRGRSAWDGKLYRGASCFVFSNKSTGNNAVKQARKLVRLMGGRPLAIDYRKHDYAFAVTSGLPHILAYSLMKVRTGSRYIPIELEGPSFAGATRVSASDPVFTG
ncbi:MAG: prephenate dehydrogenase, partial [candidate division Zixibacteria bacterium]